ncbi:Uma2 family endonuclease [Anatilimnocola floriformis]|uniref:Uma2 family endonuclease n=1 Tax=Anatilimnocola floriformis TaxID=2948575 RepID=UPI0020C2483D|nr:Uma2 family endonuclease [Anatilimnocola floriformis]
MSISSLPPPTDKLITAAELLTIATDGRVSELVRGRLVDMPPTQWAHGKVCLAIGAILTKYIDQYDVGHGTVNDSGIITKRNPDTVRGADAAFGSYVRLPKDQPPLGYWPVSPEIVFEVLSPTDRPGATLTKVAEYLGADVLAVVVVDFEDYCVYLNARNRSPQTLNLQDQLNLKQFLPESLPEWNVSIREFFKYLPNLPV